MPCSTGIGDIAPAGITINCSTGTPPRYCANNASGSIGTPMGFAPKASLCMYSLSAST